MCIHRWRQTDGQREERERHQERQTQGETHTWGGGTEEEGQEEGESPVP